jgi:hypothetical protein
MIDKDNGGMNWSLTSKMENVSKQSNNFIMIKNQELLKKHAKIKVLQDLFCYESDQVDTIIALLWSRKIDNPVGMGLLDIIDGLKCEHRYHLYKSDTYIKNLLNLLKEPVVGIIDMTNRDAGANFNLTEFGLAYYFRGDNLGI